MDNLLDHIRVRTMLILCTVGTVALVGCSPSRTPVHGHVTLDGQPLDEGAILFLPLEPGRKKTGAAIVQGGYDLNAEDGLLPGAYRVEVADNPPLASGRQSAGHPNPSSTAGRRMIPTGYSRESPLRIEIDATKAGQPREFDCELHTH